MILNKWWFKERKNKIRSQNLKWKHKNRLNKNRILQWKWACNFQEMHKNGFMRSKNWRDKNKKKKENWQRWKNSKLLLSCRHMQSIIMQLRSNSSSKNLMLLGNIISILSSNYKISVMVKLNHVSKRFPRCKQLCKETTLPIDRIC